MLSAEIQQYLQITDRLDVHQWAETTLAKHLSSNPMPVSEVEHIIDYLASDKAPARVSRMSVEQAIKKAEAWSTTLQKKAAHIEEKPEDTETVLDFKDGFRIVKLVGKAAYEREGYLMRHCVSSYFGRNVEVYSLRDKDNEPHATMEKDNQIKGKGNGSIDPKYVKYVVKFLEHVGMEVRDSEMANLGYVNVTNWKKHLGEQTVAELFDKKYHYRQKPMIGKDGAQFHCLEELDTIPLIQETRTGIKVNFDIPTFVPLSVKFLLDITKTKKTNDNRRDSARMATSGDSARMATSGYYARMAASGDYARMATSGYSAQMAASGDYARMAASGNYAQMAASGDSAQMAASGHSARMDSTGLDAVVAAIGTESKIKAKKGSWITLAEYNGRKPLCVKSAQIDGEILKEDVWYTLKNGEFTEVTP